MCDKKKILQELYDTGFVQNFTKSLAKANDVEYLEDEIQDMLLIACEIPEDRLQKMYEEDGINGVRRFMAGVIHRQMNSTTSSTHTKYRKHKLTTFTTDGMTLEELEEGYNKMDNGYKND